MTLKPVLILPHDTVSVFYEGHLPGLKCTCTPTILGWQEHQLGHASIFSELQMFIAKEPPSLKLLWESLFITMMILRALKQKPIIYCPVSFQTLFFHSFVH